MEIYTYIESVKLNFLSFSPSSVYSPFKCFIKGEKHFLKTDNMYKNFLILIYFNILVFD